MPPKIPPRPNPKVIEQAVKQAAAEKEKEAKKKDEKDDEPEHIKVLRQQMAVALIVGQLTDYVMRHSSSTNYPVKLTCNEPLPALQDNSQREIQERMSGMGYNVTILKQESSIIVLLVDRNDLIID